jgi:NAD(P)H-hydrate epimerase
MCCSLGLDDEIGQIPEDIQQYRAIGIGPGLGLSKATGLWLEQLIQECPCPLVLDADSLNLIASLNLQHKIPKYCIITPHFKELERLAGAVKNHWARLEQVKKLAHKLEIIIILKGAHSAVALPSGEVYFNTTGNPGMAKGGSGDILTGILTGLLAKGYPPEEAAFLGVYAHGKAGDLAAAHWGMTGMKSSDMIAMLPKIWEALEIEKRRKIQLF